MSVIVPVYNPGDNIDDCVRSLLDQSLPSDEYEVIFVDDGSTDETPRRLDELAAAHANVRVEHIPNSGWPGRPRNVGVDMARGEFVYFVDNDDWLGREALERMHAMAVADDADIVIGKVVGHGKTVPRQLFRQNRHGIPFERPQLLALMTPHKLFRRAMLAEHGIRFAEGPRRLEDHLYVVHAYFHARRISILADYPCYHWVLRDPSENASSQRFDPVGYYDNLREVLDVVEEHTEPGDFRDSLLVQWYRGKMLKRMGGRGLLERDPGYRRELYEEIRRLALERFDPELRRFLPLSLRVRDRLLRAGDYDGLLAFARFEAGLQPKAPVREVRPEGDGLDVLVDARLHGADEPLTFEREGDRVLWRPPQRLLAHLEGMDLDATRDIAQRRLQVLLYRVADGSQFLLPLRREPDVPEEPARLRAWARIDPATAIAGRPIPAGEWELRAVMIVGGFNGISKPRRRGALAALRLVVAEDGTIAEKPIALPKPTRPPVAPPSLRRRMARGLSRLVGRAAHDRR